MDRGKVPTRVARAQLVGLVPSVVMVVPCYNEENRLRRNEFAACLHRRGLRILFVNDGSTDGTGGWLSTLCDQMDGRASVMMLAHNVGKAEAVRQGMLHALETEADVVGYVDADFATPAREVLRLLRRLDASKADVVLGARVKLLGTAIHRRPIRHYLGRIFATLASLVLRLSVYDTQCGAKFFRRTPALSAALAEPFLSRWGFDVELLGRLVCGTHASPGLAAEKFIECPLHAWKDVSGSKMRWLDMSRLGLDLWRIRRDLRRRRKLLQHAP
jgi:dolichyl-phosphate beta-glucosyltransferase